ncbi:hypothetical protein Hamer_G027809, partial [Homarus americanus]
GQVQETERFKGACWYCEEIRHKQEDCYKRKREREQGDTEKNMEKRGCWTCGEDGHFKKFQERESQSQKLELAGAEGQRPACLTRAPLLTKCNRATVSSVQVEGEIDGVRCPLVINTASKQTFVRPDVGPVDISIKLGGEEETLQVYVVDIEDPCILGLDYYLEKGVPLRTVKHASAKITARRTVVTLPRSEVRLPRKVNGALYTRLGVVKSDCQQCCRREAVPKKCSRTTVKEDPAVTREGLEKLQLEDQDLRPKVEWMNQSSVLPAWETISGASPTTKNYWVQRDALRLKDGLLQRYWVTTDGLNRYWQTVLPQKMRSEILRVMRNSPTSGYLGVVHANRLWQYHWPVHYTWEDSDEQPLTTDEDQTGDPGRTQGRTDPRSPTMNLEEEHCSLSAELDMTGEED